MMLSTYKMRDVLVVTTSNIEKIYNIEKIVLKMNGYTFREASLSFSFFASYIIRSQLLKKIICSHRSNIFPLTVDPMKGLHCPEKHTASPEIYSPL